MQLLDFYIEDVIEGVDFEFNMRARVTTPYYTHPSSILKVYAESVDVANLSADISFDKGKTWTNLSVASVDARNDIVKYTVNHSFVYDQDFMVKLYGVQVPA